MKLTKQQVQGHSRKTHTRNDIETTGPPSSPCPPPLPGRLFFVFFFTCKNFLQKLWNGSVQPPVGAHHPNKSLPNKVAVCIEISQLISQDFHWRNNNMRFHVSFILLKTLMRFELPVFLNSIVKKWNCASFSNLWKTSWWNRWTGFIFILRISFEMLNSCPHFPERNVKS